MGSRDERDKTESEEGKASWLFLQFIPVDVYWSWGWEALRPMTSQENLELYEIFCM